jgi:hypothetical protein
VNTEFIHRGELFYLWRRREALDVGILERPASGFHPLK